MALDWKNIPLGSALSTARKAQRTGNGIWPHYINFPCFLLPNRVLPMTGANQSMRNFM